MRTRDPSYSSLFSALLKQERVRCLTLTQPWATLMALGAKMIETRSWTTSYRGPLALHAARSLPADMDALCRQDPFWTVLQTLSSHPQEYPAWRFPRGKVLAIAQLVDVIPTELASPNAQERAFGNFAKGRYAWIFSSLYPLKEPVEARGALGLWKWEPPDRFWQEMQAEFDALPNSPLKEKSNDPGSHRD